MDNRTVVDPGSEFARWDILQTVGAPANGLNLRPNKTYAVEMVPPQPLAQWAATSLATKFAHSSVNKSKQAVFCVEWTPEGRRILAGAMNGEFTLWHGMAFGFEMVMQAHENAVRCMRYSHSGEWLLSGDQDGVLKVWQPNLNNVKMERVHQENVREVAWSPSDTKFATASDDGSVKVWSFATMTEEAFFSGRQAHNWDVKCVDWHPTLGLIASGSKDNTVRLWDPRQAKPLMTIHEFKNTVTRTKFQPTGGQRLLAAASRDHTAHVFDLRMLGMTEHAEAVSVLRGHPSDVSCLEWHPVHPQLLTTATHDGSLHHFLLDSPVLRNDLGQVQPAWTIPKAHPWPIWDISYHPVGHVLATGSNDKSVRIWTRARPGDTAAEVKNPTYYSPDGEFGGGQGALPPDLLVPTTRKKSARRPGEIPGLGVDDDQDEADANGDAEGATESGASKHEHASEA